MTYLLYPQIIGRWLHDYICYVSPKTAVFCPQLTGGVSEGEGLWRHRYRRGTVLPGHQLGGDDGQRREGRSGSVQGGGGGNEGNLFVKCLYITTPLHSFPFFWWLPKLYLLQQNACLIVYLVSSAKDLLVYWAALCVSLPICTSQQYNCVQVVLIAALDGTYQRKPFANILQLVPFAESVVKLRLALLCENKCVGIGRRDRCLVLNIYRHNS